ncbi:MAG: amidohydrolase family protein [Acidobacteria bacterium]|nr:amidohydrolase family protein [Acidobacteriota bacterium]
MPDEVQGLGQLLASLGVTALTDATATNGRAELELLARAGLQQRLTCMTKGTHIEPPDGVTLGPVKVLLDDTQLPELVSLAATISDAHDHDRSIAVHCVTRVQLVLTLAALGWAGARPGDRIEHGGVIPDDLVGDLRHFGLTVVSQPAFVTARGDRYLVDVEPDDRPWLYRLRGLLDGGVPVLGSSDAPYGPPDPWLAIAAACHRRTAAGATLGPEEALDTATAIALYTGQTQLDPNGPADLCVLAEPWAHVVAHPGEVTVRATVIGGEPVYDS